MKEGTHSANSRSRPAQRSSASQKKSIEDNGTQNKRKNVTRREEIGWSGMRVSVYDYLAYVSTLTRQRHVHTKHVQGQQQEGRETHQLAVAVGKVRSRLGIAFFSSFLLLSIVITLIFFFL